MGINLVRGRVTKGTVIFVGASNTRTLKREDNSSLFYWKISAQGGNGFLLPKIEEVRDVY